MLLQEERELIVEYGKKLSLSGLCPGTSGNISIYNAELGYMAISPSGIDYFETKPEDVPDGPAKSRPAGERFFPHGDVRE